MQQDNTWIAKLTALMGSLALCTVAPDAGLTVILSGLATNIGSQYLYDLFNPKWQKLWQGKDGILNHDIQKALVSAVENAGQTLLSTYKTRYQPDERELKDISRFLTDLYETAKTRLLLPDAENEVQAQELLQYLSFTTKDKIYQQIAERLQLQATLQADEKDRFNLSDRFITFLKEALGATLQEAFVQALTGNDIAKEKMQWLYFECLQQSVTAGNAQILEALHQLNTQTTRTDTYGELWTGAIRRFYERFDKLEKGQEKILKAVENLPENIQEAVNNALQNLPPAALIPNFSASGRYQMLRQQLQDKQQQFEQNQTEIAETREDIATMSEGRPKERLQKTLNDLESGGLQLSQSINDAEKELQNFMTDVLKLAATLGTSATTPSQRLQTARELFEQGEFEKANEALSETAIFEERNTYRHKLKELAEELLLKGQLTALNKTLPNWFKEATRFYTEAVNTHANYDTCFACAYFLAAHNQHNAAIQYYRQALPFAKDDAEKATMLNNLAILLKAKNEFAAALENYEEALQIYRALAQENPATYLPSVALTLNNLGLLQYAKNEFAAALENYEAALQIYRALVQENPATYLPDVAMTLNNLANLQYAKNEFAAALENYEEALQIRRALAQENPATYLPSVAETLNNLANLQYAKNEFAAALENYEAALQIYRALAQENPATYLPDVAMTAMNLSIFYIQSQPNQEVSLVYAKEALLAALPFKDTLPRVQQYVDTIMRILQYWGIDPQAFIADLDK